MLHDGELHTLPLMPNAGLPPTSAAQSWTWLELSPADALDPFHLGAELSNGTPGHGHEDPAHHGLDEGHRSVHRLTPARHAPALFAPSSSLLQIRELPEVVHPVKVARRISLVPWGTRWESAAELTQFARTTRPRPP